MKLYLKWSPSQTYPCIFSKCFQRTSNCCIVEPNQSLIFPSLKRKTKKKRNSPGSCLSFFEVNCFFFFNTVYVIYYSSDYFTSEAYSEPRETSKIELSVKTVYGFKPLTIFVKSSVWDIWFGSEYTSGCSKNKAADLFPNQTHIGTFLKHMIDIIHKEETGVKISPGVFPTKQAFVFSDYLE